MDTWFLFAVISQFMFAVVVLIDRFIVAKGVVSKPIVYAFYVSVLSIFALLAAPFGVTLPTGRTAILSLAVAVSYLFSIYMLYESLKKSKPMEVVPVVGGVAAIAAFAGSHFFLNATLPNHFIIGFVILVIGMVFISHFEFNIRSFLFLSGSGVFFGLSTVIIKAIFDQDTLINGFFWSRMANVLVALSLLFVPRILAAVKQDMAKPGKSNKTLLVIGNKTLAALGFIFTLIAIKGGDVAIVNALTATQYVFLLLFAIFFTRLLPEYFHDKVHPHELFHKCLATTLIVIGFFILFL